MVLWRVRAFHHADLDAAIRPGGGPPPGGEAPFFGLSALITAVRAGEPAVVAVVDDQLAGTAAATVSGGRAWIVRISLAAAGRNRGIGSAMLTELERRLVAVGVHRIDCLLATGDEVGALALEHGGYRARPGTAAGGRAVRPAGDGQDHLRQRRRSPAWLAVRRAVPLPSGR